MGKSNRRSVWITVAIVLIVLLLAGWYTGWTRIFLLNTGLRLERVSLSDRIRTSSVIVVARWESREGHNQCIIAELLKKDSNSSFHYDLGDSYDRGGFGNQPGIDYGDGQILFFSGSLPRLDYAATYSHGRIRAFGELTVEALRDLVKQANE